MSVSLIKGVSADQALYPFDGDMISRDELARADYYFKAALPPGTWHGDLADYGLQGREVLEGDYKSLFLRFAGPATGRRLSGRDPRSASTTKFWGLTFTVPKSLSVHWALCDDPRERALIYRLFDQSVAMSMGQARRWGIFHTRRGQDGVVRETDVRMLWAQFPHFDSREGDPHLHAHVNVLDLAKTGDGKYLSLNGRELYAATVALSEYHELVLADLLRQAGYRLRERVVEGRNGPVSRQELADITDAAIDQMSKRSRQVSAAMRGRGYVEHHHAWQSTRKPKRARSLEDIHRRTKRELAAHGLLLQRPHVPGPDEYESVRPPLEGARESVIASNVIASLEARLPPGGLERIIHDIKRGLEEREGPATSYRVMAEAARHLAGVPMSPEQAATAVEEITTRVCAGLTRIEGPERNRATWPYDTRLHATGSIEYAAQGALATERRLRAAAKEAMPPLTEPGRVRPQALAGLSPDQAGAVAQLLTAGKRISALVGPAGTGKTHALRAIRHQLDSQGQTGVIRALALSARAAAELQESLGVQAVTVSKLLHENSTEQIERRHEWRRGLMAQLESRPLDPVLLRRWSAAVAREQSWQIPWGGVLVVDEASMDSTHDLDQLLGLCRQHGARMLLTGDPYQLNSPHGGSGYLGWMLRAHQGRPVALHDPGTGERTRPGDVEVAELTRIWRFADPVEAGLTTLLRSCADRATAFEVVAGYEGLAPSALRGLLAGTPAFPGPGAFGEGCGAGEGKGLPRLGESRLHHGLAETVEAQLAERRATALARGEDHLLLCSDNDTAYRLNQMVRDRLVERGRLTPPAQGNRHERVRLSEGAEACTGDLLVMRRNEPRVLGTGGSPLRNGQSLTLTQTRGVPPASLAAGPEPAVRLTDRRTGEEFDVPRPYLQEHGQLGYALTAYQAQGQTVRSADYYIAPGSRPTRPEAYVAMSRGTRSNHLWQGLDIDPEADIATMPMPAQDRRMHADTTRRLINLLSTPGLPLLATEEWERNQLAQTDPTRQTKQDRFLHGPEATP